MEQKTVQIAARIPEEDRKALEEFCEKHDESMSKVIRMAIREYLDFHSED